MAVEDLPDRAERVAKYAGGIGLATLAPMFALILELLDGGTPEPEASAIFQGRVAPVGAPQRLVLRKALAFDHQVRFRLGSALGFMGFGAFAGVFGFHGRHGKGDRGAWFACAVLALVALAILREIVARLRELRRMTTRCAVVRGRVFVKRPRPGRRDISMDLTVAYTVEGEGLCQAHLTFPWDVGALVSWNPELLVDPKAPLEPLIRDFYT